MVLLQVLICDSTVHVFYCNTLVRISLSVSVCPTFYFGNYPLFYRLRIDWLLFVSVYPCVGVFKIRMDKKRKTMA